MTTTVLAVTPLSRRAFCFDPWECYKRASTYPVPMMLTGLVGTGQSMPAKAYAVRESEFLTPTLRWKAQ
jgi:hypothetical protein